MPRKTQEQQQQIEDKNKGKYFHIILNMADDDLTPYEYRLLGHYIRVGECWEGVRTTAKTCRMSVGMVVKTRNALTKLGYIKAEHRDKDTVFVTVVDRMAENVARYVNRSPHEQGVQDVNERITPEEEHSNKNQEEDNTFPSGNGRAFSGIDGTLENVVVEESQEDTPAVEETTHDNGERNQPLSPSSAAPPSPSDTIFAAVAEVWQHDGARAGNIAAIIGGKSKVKGWKSFNFSPVGTPLGVRVFGAWYKLRCNGLHLPEEPEAIQSWYYKMRNDYEANPYQPVFAPFNPQKASATYTTTYAPEPDDTPQEAVNYPRAQQWQIIYEALELQLDKANFDMWLRGARLLEFNEDTQAFVVGVRNESAQQFLSYRLNREIDSVLRDVASGLVDIRWTA